MSTPTSTLPSEPSTQSSASTPVTTINPNSISEGAKIGIGVGIGVTVLLVLLALFVCFADFRRRRKRKAVERTPHEDEEKGVSIPVSECEKDIETGTLVTEFSPGGSRTRSIEKEKDEMWIPPRKLEREVEDKRIPMRKVEISGPAGGVTGRSGADGVREWELLPAYMPKGRVGSLGGGLPLDLRMSVLQGLGRKSVGSGRALEEKGKRRGTSC